MKDVSRVTAKRVCGLDLGDKTSFLCVCSPDGEVIDRARLRTSDEGLAKRLKGVDAMRVAIEAGPHSPWVSRLLAQWGHEVLVANPRKVRLIGDSRKKSDRIDAQSLADLASVRPRLLYPIQHIGAEAQAHRSVLRSRDALVKARSGLITHARGLVKAIGGRLPSCSAESFAKKAAVAVPEALRPALTSILHTIEQLTRTIRDSDRQIAQISKHYPQLSRLTQIEGVGPISSLAFLLALGEPGRFTSSRTVGAYFGLVPAQRSSGASDPQLHISKQGDPFVRKLLVQCAHYILGPFAKDSDLRRYGQRIAARGGKNAKKRATVAVARKLSVVLHRLLVTGRTYEPLYDAQRQRPERLVA